VRDGVRVEEPTMPTNAMLIVSHLSTARMASDFAKTELLAHQTARHDLAIRPSLDSTVEATTRGVAIHTPPECKRCAGHRILKPGGGT
jgi:hypothetical protein